MPGSFQATANRLAEARLEKYPEFNFCREVELDLHRTIITLPSSTCHLFHLSQSLTLRVYTLPLPAVRSWSRSFSAFLALHGLGVGGHFSRVCVFCFTPEVGHPIFPFHISQHATDHSCSRV